MRPNAVPRDRGRAGAPGRPVSTSRAPHASTAKLDASELRNPSALYTQAESLAKQFTLESASSQPYSSSRSRSNTGFSAGTHVPASSLSTPHATLLRVGGLPLYANGSSSALYRTVLKTPALTQAYMHGQFTTNASDVLRQFTSELRFFQNVKQHRNIATFVGSLEGVGMLLEYVEGETLWKHLGRGHPMSVRADWFNQILAGTCHIHSFGFGHNDLCSLNVVITLLSTPHPTQSSRQKYVAKLLDFGRSSVEPKPAPVPSALAALRSAQQTALRMRLPAATLLEDQERERREREKDLIYPGTRPFAAPEIMRAWILSEAGKGSNVTEEDEADDESDGDHDTLEMEDTWTNDDPYHQPYAPPTTAPPPLPLPLSTPAYAREDDTHSQRMNSLGARGQALRARMPILAFSDPQAASQSSPLANASNDNSYPRSRFAAGRRESLDAYPSPSSSPTNSGPSSPSNHPFPHDDAADVVHEESPRFRGRRSRSRSRSGFESRGPPNGPTAIRNRDPIAAEAIRKARRKARHRLEIEALHSQDPHPLSPILGDTYSLGVIALCLERDILVDVSPSVQMRELWRPLDMENRHAVGIPDAQGRTAFFDGRFASTSSNSRIKGKGVSNGAASLIERYMRPVRQRERCSLSDALDVDMIREAERGWAGHVGLFTSSSRSAAPSSSPSVQPSKHSTRDEHQVSFDNGDTDMD